MITLFSYLLTFLAIAFWIFRVIVTLMFQLDMPIFAEPLDLNLEIIVLFLTIPCIVFVMKRKIFGAALYVALYVSYFGTALYNKIIDMETVGFNMLNSTDILFLFVGVLIPILTFLDICLNRNRVRFQTNDKTDWFYKNEQFDRKYDERADKNQYKF